MSGIATVFKKLFGFLNGIRKIIVNLVFFIVLAVVLTMVLQQEEPIEVPDGGMLVLDLNGVLVEEKTWVSPVDKFINQVVGSGSDIPEVLLADVLESVTLAQEDDRIGGIYLNLSSFMGGGLNKLQTLGTALQEFKESGKPIYTYADYYSQSQYYLAAHADHVYLNPLGGLMFDGFGSYRLYYKDMLEKLKVSTHIFKVGAYKSAVEPFTRNDMSEQAREANAELYNELWDDFIADLTRLRDIDPRFLSGKIDDFRALSTASNNDLAQLTVAAGLVDALKTREQLRTEMINLAGLDEDEESWQRIDHDRYLAAQQQQSMSLTDTDDSAQIAVVIARGTIVDGYQKAGMIGGDSTAELLRKARNNEQTKAVVLRIDSPGGSGFASEIIRQEVLELQKAGIPVIASMSSVAASGGYWIAASADEIWASPNTITGSIGVFGMFFTIEDALQEIGVYNDGFKTTEMPTMDITRPLSDGAKEVIQLNIEKFYRDFVSMVAESRNMTYDQVHAVAQGRVWTGTRAQQLGLVDQLGNFEDAILAAARKANLDDYEVITVQQDLSPREVFLADMLGQSQVLLPMSSSQLSAQHPLKQQLTLMWKQVEQVTLYNDPNGVYALCELCPIQ